MLLPIIALSSCAAIRETAVVNAPQTRVREVIAEEILHKGGMILDDSKFTLTAEYPNPNRTDAFLSSRPFQEWVFNLAGDNPTRVVLKPWARQGFNRIEIPSMDSATLPAVKETLANIKREAEEKQQGAR
jgi:hypothetical protein